MLGIAYKKNVDDLRESPALKIIELLSESFAKVSYSDPHIPFYKDQKIFKSKLRSVKLTPKEIEKYDALIITTDHDLFDFKMIQKNSDLIIDTRGVYKDKYKNVVRA